VERVAQHLGVAIPAEDGRSSGSFAGTTMKRQHQREIFIAESAGHRNSARAARAAGYMGSRDRHHLTAVI